MLILTSYPELENDRWTVEMSFILNVNFYNQISSFSSAKLIAELLRLPGLVA